jgi:hypothetical protein
VLECGQELLVAGGWLLVGTWEFDVAAAVEEGGCGVGGDLPAVGCDFDNFTVGVGEIEEDNIWIAWIAAGGDAAIDGEVCSTAIGTCGEGANGLAKSVGAGRLVVVAVEGGDEPVADAR